MSGRAATGRRGLLLGLAGGLLAPALPAAATSAPLGGAAALLWEAVRQRAWGQTVRFHLLRDEPGLEGFLGWAAAELAARHGVALDLVPLRDRAEALGRIGGGEAVDLVALDAPGLLALRQRELLLPVLPALPHAVAPRGGAARPPVALPGLTPPATSPLPGPAPDRPLPDRLVPGGVAPGGVVPGGAAPGPALGGFGGPWRAGRLVLLHDAGRTPEPPASMLALPDWARARTGQVAHPPPRHPLGTAFLLQALHELVPHPRLLASPATDLNFTLLTAPFWEWYVTLRPHLWRHGQAFPEDAAALRLLLREKAVQLVPALMPAMTLPQEIQEPQEAQEQDMLPRLAALGEVPAATRAQAVGRGSLAQSLLLAVPRATTQPEAAMVAADFLLSPRALARLSGTPMGTPTRASLLPRGVSRDGSSTNGAAGPDAAQALPARPASQPVPGSVPVSVPASVQGPGAELLPEPHPSWGLRLAQEWERRMGSITP